MVAVFVHQVVGIPLELISQLLHYFINVLLCKVCRTQSYSLSEEETQLVRIFLCVAINVCVYVKNSLEFESLPQFWGISRVDLKNATEGIWMAAICKLYREQNNKH